MSEPIEIRCRENGPYVIKGPVRIIDHLGNAFEIPPGKDTVALCRCGQSKKRPFCDGTHKTCAFLAAEIAVPITPGCPAPDAVPPRRLVAYPIPAI